MGLFDRFKKKDHDDENIDESVKTSASTGEESTGEDIRSVDEGEESSEEIPVNQTAEEAVDQEKSDVRKEADDQNDDDTQTEEIPEEHKQGFFKRLVAGLTKTRNQLTESLNQIFKGHSELDDDFYDELEEVLIMADLGLETTDKIIDDLIVRVKQYKIKEVEPCRELLNNIIRDQMMVDDSAYDFEDQKTVMLIIGVNGVGKTTSIGKLAAQYKNRGKKVLMAAGDTFRAAAIDQLKTWAERAGVEIIAQQEGSDPAAVVYDAVQAAKARNVDILLCDTAGRLHNKKNLMDELAKMRRIIEKEYPEAHLETLIVLDGSTGQNALEQARQFREVTDLNGIILTKLDGTAKGGIAIAIQSELDVPVKYIGVGEKINDLQRFDPNRYVEALFADFEVKSDVEMLIEEEDE